MDKRNQARSGGEHRGDESFFRGLLERVSEIVIAFENGGTVGYASPSVEHLLGCRTADLCGSNIFDHLHQEDVERVSKDIAKVSDHPETEAPVRLRFRRSDGAWRTVAGSLSRHPGGSSADNLVLTLREEPGREAAGTALPYEALVRNGADLVTLCNEDGAIRYISPPVKEVLGYEPEELAGVRMHSLIHPDDRDYTAGHAGSLSEKSTVRQGPVRYRRKDGSWVYLESLTENLLSDPDVVGLLVNSRDVTSRVWAEEEVRRLSRSLDAQVPQQMAGLVAAVTQMEDHEPLLRERAESLRRTFEHAAVGIAQIGVDGEWLMANRRFCEMTGYAREELLQRTLGGLFHPEDRGDDFGERECLTEGIGAHPVEKRLTRKDGRLIWIEMTASLVRDPSGDTRSYVLVAEDVTERKESEEALRQSEERYRAVVEQTAECLFLFDAETKRILESNPAFRELFGYSVEDLQEMTIYDLGEDDPANVNAYACQNRERGRLDLGARRYRRRDGSVVDVEVSGSVISYQGHDSVVLGIARDVTGRKEAEEALRLSEERFRYLVQYASDVITIVGRDGTVFYESPSIRRVLGYEPEELVGASAFAYVHPDDRDRLAGALASCVSGERASEPVDFRFRHADGSWRHFEAIGSNLTDKPSIGGIVINSRDVTERKQAEAGLKRNLDMLLALHEANRTLSSTLEAEEIVSRLLEIMRRVSDLDVAGVRMLSGERRKWNERTVGSGELWDRAVKSLESISACESVLRDERPVSFRLSPEDDGGKPMVGLSLPLRTRNDVVGVLEAYGPESLAEDGTIEILESLARQAATALENARLYEQLAEREQRLQDLIGKLLKTQEEERRRVAYEVHDGLAQVAVAAHQHLQVFARRHHWGRPKSQEDLQRILRLVRSTVTESRRIIANLRPTALDDLGLASAIALEVENLRDSGYRVDFEDGLGEERLPPPAEIALYRVTQEALTNMRKHAETREACIRLWRQEGWAYVEVRDRGRGFDPERGFVGAGPGERMGLSGMRERVVMLGGEFNVRSRPGNGTSVVVGIPL